MTRIAFVGRTHTGLKRKNNEDKFLIVPELNFCLVSDGMGGAAAGELASEMLAQTVQEVFREFGKRSDDETPDIIYHALRMTNEQILEHVKAYPFHSGMGCTAEVMSFSKNGYIYGHIGDSRIYCFRNNELTQLTHDHSLVQSLIDEQLLSQDKAKSHHLKHIILRSVGNRDHFSIDIGKGSLYKGDIFLLCSDGLTDMVEDRQIRDILAESSPIAEKADKLIQAALDGGGLDNVTIVLCELL